MSCPLAERADLGSAPAREPNERGSVTGLLVEAVLTVHNAGLVAMPWTEARVLKQFELGEDTRVEFKEVFFGTNRVNAPERRDVADELAALGNTVGGTLIFSVSDEVRPMSRDQMDELEKFIREICRDSIKPELSIISQRVALPDNRSALVVEVQQSTSVHRSPGGYMHRHGSEKRQLSSVALDRLFQKRGRSGRLGPDEAVVVGTGRNTLEAALVDRLTSSRVTEAVDAQLLKLGLLREGDNGATGATVAGVLLCAERPDRYIGGAVIEAVRYDGTVLGAAGQLDAATIAGPLDRQIRDAVRFVRFNTHVAARKAPGRMETPQFDPGAVFEAIVNAVVHRDYSMENARTRLFIFDDRMELYSPGALPNTLRIEDMRDRQATRNEVLASVFRRLPAGDVDGAGNRQHFLERRGKGVPIIYERTWALAGNDPFYELLGGAELRLTLPSARPPTKGIAGELTVFCGRRPLPGVTVVALYPNKTRIQRDTDTLGRVRFEFHSQLPITVFLRDARVCRACRAPLVAAGSACDRTSRAAFGRLGRVR